MMAATDTPPSFTAAWYRDGDDWVLDVSVGDTPTGRIDVRDRKYGAEIVVRGE